MIFDIYKSSFAAEPAVLGSLHHFLQLLFAHVLLLFNHLVNVLAFEQAFGILFVLAEELALLDIVER